MTKIYVIAGTYNESMNWIRQDLDKRYATTPCTMSISDYRYVSHAHDLRGIRDPHGVFVGNWLGRPDILEIVEELMLCSTHPNPALGKIYRDLKPMVRPTPKKIITANEVSAEVIKIFNGGDMTNRYKEVRKAMDTL